jgi:hypothetical protein
LTAAARHIARSANTALMLALAIALLAGSLMLAAPAGARGHRAACAATTTSHAAHGRDACVHSRRTRKDEKRSPTGSTRKAGGEHGKGRSRHSSTRAGGAGAEVEAQDSEEAEEEEGLEEGEEGSETEEG